MDNNQSEVGKDYLTPQAAVFGNHLILEIILRQLSTANLRNAQLVNKFWNTIASSILRKERRLKFRFNHRTSIDVIREYAATETNLATIYEWEFGNIFHLTPQDIANCKANVDTLNALISEDSTGHLAAGLVFAIGCSDFSLETESQKVFSFFEKVIFGVRNLNVLTLNLRDYRHDVLQTENGRKLQHLHLPHLEQITFILKKSPTRTPWKPICKLVMNAAPNLKVIKGSALNSIWDVILESGKAACVKSYTIEQQEPPWSSLHMDTMLRGIDSMLEHTPTLELLKLDRHLFTRYNPQAERGPLDVWTAIRRLVFHYRKSLRHIRIAQLAFPDYAIGQVGDSTEAPVFENLEYIYITTSRLYHILPFLSMVKNQLPYLTRVRLELMHLSGYALQEDFPRCRGKNGYIHSLPNVRKLEISGFFDKKDMQVLRQVFPKVKEVKIYQVIGEFMHCLQNGLRNMLPSVECLTLHFMANDHRIKLNNLDELLTGIRKSTLANLPRDVAQDVYLKIASRKGIRKLRALKRLRIIFDINESAMARSTLEQTPNSIRDNMEFPFFIKKGTFTTLSSLYAFSSPDCTTYIYYDRRVHVAQIERMIKEFQPHVIAVPCFVSQVSPVLAVALAERASEMGIEFQPPPTDDDPELEQMFPEFPTIHKDYWTTIKIT